MNTIYSSGELKKISKEFKMLWKLLKNGKLIYCPKCQSFYELNVQFCEHFKGE